MLVFLLSNCKQSIRSLSLLVGMTVVAYFQVAGHKSQNKQDMQKKKSDKDLMLFLTTALGVPSVVDLYQLNFSQNSTNFYTGCRSSLIRSTRFAFQTNSFRVPALKTNFLFDNRNSEFKFIYSIHISVYSSVYSSV